MNRSTTCLACVALGVTLLATSAQARAPARHARAVLLEAQAADVGPAAAAAAARGATGGTVLGVRQGQSGGRTVYRVKVLLPDGRVRVISVDGASGQVIG